MARLKEKASWWKATLLVLTVYIISFLLQQTVCYRLPKFVAMIQASSSRNQSGFCDDVIAWQPTEAESLFLRILKPIFITKALMHFECFLPRPSRWESAQLFEFMGYPWKDPVVWVPGLLRGDWRDIRSIKGYGFSNRMQIANSFFRHDSAEMNFDRVNVPYVLKLRAELSASVDAYVLQYKQRSLRPNDLLPHQFCLLLNFAQCAIRGIGASLHFPVLLTSVVNCETKQYQGADRNEGSDDNGPPIGPRVRKEWRACVSASLLACSLLIGLCGFWLVYTSGRVEDVSVINIPRIAAGILLIAIFWVICHAALDILDFGQVYSNDLVVTNVRQPSNHDAVTGLVCIVVSRASAKTTLFARGGGRDVLQAVVRSMGSFERVVVPNGTVHEKLNIAAIYGDYARIIQNQNIALVARFVGRELYDCYSGWHERYSRASVFSGVSPECWHRIVAGMVSKGIEARFIQRWRLTKILDFQMDLNWAVLGNLYSKMIGSHQPNPGTLIESQSITHSEPLEKSKHSIYTCCEEYKSSKDSGNAIVVFPEPISVFIKEDFHFHWIYLPFGVMFGLLGMFGVLLLVHALDESSGVTLLKGLGFCVVGWTGTVFFIFHWLYQG